MKKKQLRAGIFIPILFILIAAATALRSIAIFTEFDFSTSYYSGGIFITAANSIAVLGVLVSLSYLFTEARRTKLIPSFSGSATYIPAGMVAVALVFMALGFLISSIRGESEGWAKTLSPIIAILASLGVVGFLLTTLTAKREDNMRAAFSMATVLFLAVYSLYLYCSSDLPINAPNKATDQMAYVASALFFLYETRISLGRSKWAAYIAFGMAAATLTAYSSIPSLIVYFADGAVISNSIYETALTFALFVYITSRVSLAFALPLEKESTIVTSIREASARREEELASMRAEEPQDTEADTPPANYTMDIDINAQEKENEE